MGAVHDVAGRVDDARNRVVDRIDLLAKEMGYNLPAAAGDEDPEVQETRKEHAESEEKYGELDSSDHLNENELDDLEDQGFAIPGSRMQN